MLFAISITSSSVLKRNKGATGPKVSSLKISASVLTSANTVGSKKVPFFKPLLSVWRFPPAISFAPFETASLTWLSTFSTAAISISGP